MTTDEDGRVIYPGEKLGPHEIGRVCAHEDCMVGFIPRRATTKGWLCPEHKNPDRRKRSGFLNDREGYDPFVHRATAKRRANENNN